MQYARVLIPLVVSVLLVLAPSTRGDTTRPMAPWPDAPEGATAQIRENLNKINVNDRISFRIGGRVAFIFEGLPPGEYEVYDRGRDQRVDRFRVNESGKGKAVYKPFESADKVYEVTRDGIIYFSAIGVGPDPDSTVSRDSLSPRQRIAATLSGNGKIAFRVNRRAAELSITTKKLRPNTDYTLFANNIPVLDLRSNKKGRLKAKLTTRPRKVADHPLTFDPSNTQYDLIEDATGAAVRSAMIQGTPASSELDPLIAFAASLTPTGVINEANASLAIQGTAGDRLMLISALDLLPGREYALRLGNSTLAAAEASPTGALEFVLAQAPTTPDELPLSADPYGKTILLLDDTGDPVLSYIIPGR